MTPKQKIKNKNTIKFFSFGFLFLAALVVCGYAKADTPNVVSKTTPKQEVGRVADCFQYYKFGSIKMDLSGDKYTYGAGDTINFKGKVTNENDYPIVDGGIFTKIYRRDPKGSQAINGGFEVSEFYALTNIELGSKQSKDVSFRYLLPKGLANGDYDIQFFFEVGNKYNLAGLSFHVAEPGSTTKISIKGGNTNAIYFDKDKVQLNNQPYVFREISRPLEVNKPINISVPLQNPTQNKLNVTLKKEIYYWDALNEQNKISESSEELSLAPGQKAIDINYQTSGNLKSVYLFRLTAVSDAGQTVIDVRPNVSGVFLPRLNFVGLTSFPIVKGHKSSFFACFHNTDFGQGEGKLALTLKDENGAIISQKEYQGQIPGEMIADTQEFIPEKNYPKVQLLAQLYDSQGKLVDSSSHTYDCSSFNPSICNIVPNEPESPKQIDMPTETKLLGNSVSDHPQATQKIPLRTILLLILIAIIIAGISIFYLERKKANRIAKNVNKDSENKK